MNPYSIKVWYFCKECTISFHKLEDFFDHKSRIHFSELQNTKCIIFEERIENEDPQHFSSPANFTQHFEPQLNESEVVCGLQDSLNINDPELHFNVNAEDSFECELNENIDNENIGNETVSHNFHSDSDFGAFYNVTVNADVKPAIVSSENTSNEETTETTTIGENIDPLSFDFEPQSQAQLIIYENLVQVENKSSKVPIANETRVKALQNPYITLTRLTSKEIQHYNYKQSSIKDSLGDSDASFEYETEIPVPAPSANSFECQLCSKKLDSQPQLKIHVGICSLYHNDRHRFCVPCNHKFCRSYSLKLHCRKYHGTNELVKESQRSKPPLFTSQLRSTNEKVKFTATTTISTRPHQVNNGLQSKSYKVHKCDQCDYFSWRKSNVALHKAHKHSNERPFKCSQPNCGRAFKTRTHLTRHRTCHSDEKPFKCVFPNCYGTFKRKSYVTDHVYRAHRSSMTLTLPQSNCYSNHSYTMGPANQ